MSTFASNYVVFEIVFYPSSPTPSTLPQSIQIADTSLAAAVADVMALYPNAVVVSVGPVTEPGSIVVPAAASVGTSSPATLFSALFYENANLAAQASVQVLANTEAQAWAVVLNAYPNAKRISVTPSAGGIPATVNLQTA